MTKNKPIDSFKSELEALTRALIECSLVNDQRYVFRKIVGSKNDGTLRETLEATYWEESDVNVMASIPYSELHAQLIEERAYDLLFVDGGLVQARFEFDCTRHGALLRSRLAYLPAPDLTPFQQDPETYLLDEIFGDVIDTRSVTTPIRFDYDAREDVIRDVHHPKAHVTLGQYPHCRIAATGPVTPYYFIEFIVRSFYRTKSTLPTDKLPEPHYKGPMTITPSERALVHFGVPTSN